MLPIPISELWESFRNTTVAADASENEIELAWSAFHGGIFAICRVLAHMDANGDGVRSGQLVGFRATRAITPERR